MALSGEGLPPWATDILRCPESGGAMRQDGGRLVSAEGADIGWLEAGILRFRVEQPDAGIAFYRKVGGAHFHERASVPFAMSALDTPLYHSYLDEVRPADENCIIVDVGGGDGRNALPWLERGYRRIVIVDAAAEALVRFRARIAAQHAEWLERLLLVEADARRLPFADRCAHAVLAVEAIGCLNDDYGVGLRECARVLVSGCKMLLSERGYEGGLVLRLVYHGVDGLLDTAGTRDLWDGPADNLLRTRCFTEAELLAEVNACGLKVAAVKGTSILALLLGWLKGRGLIDEKHTARLPEVVRLLRELGQEGALRRCHVVIAERG